MKPIFKFTVYILLFFNGILNSAAQVPGVEDYVSRIDSLGVKYPVEKVYLHLDKPYYSSGQDLWFRAYVTDGANRPSMLSKVLYVDLINPGNKIIRAMRLPLAAGLGSGDISLPDTLPEGIYRLRAYTQWMRNFGEESFFERELKISNPLADEVLAAMDLRSYSGGENQTELSIKYTTITGELFRAKEIDYTVTINGKKLVQTKGLTDDEGRLTIRFTPGDNLRENGVLATSFEHNGRRVNKSFPFRGSHRELDLKFFPEGGHLVDSIPSRVAFKALGPDGLGVQLSGYIEDSRGARVAEFKTGHAGMGSFMLTPFSRQIYTAFFSYDGTDRRVELPKASQEGYILNLIGEDDQNLKFRIAGSNNLALNREVKIAVRSGSGTHGIIGFKMSRQFIDIVLPREDFPDGVVQVTLFSPENLPVAERLVFIRPRRQLELSIETDKQQYNSREKVNMRLKAKSIDNEPVIGSFSIAVTDRLPAGKDERTIFSELLLRSELRGNIEDPNYYFSGDDNQGNAHLNNLLLTQGWRRLRLEQELPSIRFAAENGISISGSVSSRGNAVENGKVTLFSPDAVMSVDTLTDSKGRFNFDKLVFKDSTRFVVQARTEKERSNVQISLDVTGVPPVLTPLQTGRQAENVTEQERKIIKDNKDELRELMNQGLLKRTNVLEEVVVKAQTYSRTMKNSSKLGNTEPDFVVTQDKIKDMPNLAHALYNKVPGMTIDFDPRDPTMAIARLFRNDQKLSGPVPMAVYLDGQFTGTDLNVINPNAVAYIEVLKTAAKTAVYGNNGFGGVIIVTTKIFAGIPDEPVLESARGIIAYKPKGYAVTRDFYSPDYSIKETRKDIKDFRSTIYWNPELFTGKGKNPEFSFFTADRPGTYRAVVEGLDYKGRLGRKVITFTVE